MCQEKEAKSFDLHQRWCAPLMLISFLMLILCSSPSASAQEGGVATPDKISLSTELLFKSPAKLLFEGNNTIPIGELKVKTYRLEEVKLPKPLELKTRGRSEKLESVIRLTITGESFQQGQYTVWLDDEALSDVMRSPTELTTVIFDRSAAEEGAVIAVSYETSGDHSRTALPERFYLPPEARGDFSSGSNNVNAISRIRKVNAGQASSGEKLVEIELTSDVEFQNRNAQTIIQVGDFESYGDISPDGDSYKWIVRMPLEVFMKLKDGSTVWVKSERGARGLRGARKFGRLNKSLLEQ